MQAGHGLVVCQGNRLERLAERLAEELRTPVGHPLEAEHVVVPNSGMARWLSLRLADQLGVCLNVQFSLPGALVWQLWRCLLDCVPDETEFSADVLTWRIFAQLAHLGHPALRPLERYVEEADELRRFELAQRLGGLFDQYLVYRGDLILSWESHERRSTATTDEVWQAELWRRLIGSSPARHRARLAREFALATDGGALAVERLPRRLSIFGIPALAPVYLDAFDRLSRWTEVHLYLLNPCRLHFGHILPEREIARRAGDRDPAELYLESGNHLLASMGQQGRDFIEMVIDRGGETRDLFEDPPGASMLEVLQSDILDLRCRGTPETPQAEITRDDRSVRLHLCHTPMREVEVLHDQLLDLFECHPDLDPSDVRVMTPDIEIYAPLIEAVFGTAEGDRHIPYLVADRVPRAESPTAAAFLGLLEIVESRHDAARILALLEAKPVRRRFEIHDDDLTLINTWVRTSGIRWGIDAASRTALGLPPSHENTWRFGLDRLMLGYAMAGEGRHLFAGILPCDDVEGVQAAVMGRLQRFAETLFDTSAALARPRPPREWGDLLTETLDRLFDTRDAGDELEAILAAIRDLVGAAEQAGYAEPIALPIVRAEVERRLASPGAAWAFLGGAVTFCTMVPMRNIPAPVVCLIGMKDDAFPRSRRPPSFDLMAGSFRLGDRSRRDDDRYLFLEALLSARRCFYASWVGRGVRDNAPLPPSVLVGELEDAIRTGFRLEEDARVLDHVRTIHPLQAFSRRYFEPGSELFSYAHELCEASRASTPPSARGALASSEPFLRLPLPRADDEWRTVALDRLLRFFQHPQRFFLKERLGIALEESEELIEAQEPFTLDGLASYRLREELLDLELSGEPREHALPAARASGVLPHGQVGESLFEAAEEDAEQIARRLRAERSSATTVPETVDLTLGELRLIGPLTGRGAAGIVAFRVGDLDARWLLALWIRHLVLHAHLPSAAGWRSLLVARDKTFALAPVEDARDHLTRLLQLYWEGIHAPLRFSPVTSFACVKQETTEKARVERARAVRRGWRDAYVDLAFRGSDMLDDPFLAIAAEVFAPLARHEDKT